MTDYKLPEGFMWLARTGDAMPFVHVESRKFGCIPAVIVKTSGVNQDEVNYHCSNLLREVARGS